MITLGLSVPYDLYFEIQKTADQKTGGNKSKLCIKWLVRGLREMEQKEWGKEEVHPAPITLAEKMQ